jgi:hypothetical protein
MSNESISLLSIIHIQDPSVALQKTMEYLDRVLARTEDEVLCYNNFHHLIFSIFGYERKQSWLHEAQTNATIYNQVMNLLKPTGPLFRIMFMYLQTYGENNKHWRFPIGKLPVCSHFAFSL